MIGGVAEHVLALVEHVLGVVELARNRVLDVVEQFEDIATRHDTAGRHGNTSCLFDDGHEFVESFKYPVHSYPNPAHAITCQ